MEHGSPVIRALVEGRVVLKWLALKDDAELYARFRNYGRGRLKLLKLHLEDYRDSLDKVPDGLNEHIEVFSPGFAVHGRAGEASLQVSVVSRPSAECLLAGACSEGPR